MIRALAILLAAPAAADTPLPLAADWQRTHPGGVVAEGTLDPPQIRITAPGATPWALGFWLQPHTIHPSPDGEYVLVSNAGGNILSAGFESDDAVLWIYQRPGGEEIAQVPLGILARRGALEQTASGFVWIDSYIWAVDGWAFETPDGQGWHLSTDLRLERR